MLGVRSSHDRIWVLLPYGTSLGLLTCLSGTTQRDELDSGNLGREKQVSVKMCRQVKSSLDLYVYLSKETQKPKVKTSESTVFFETNLFKKRGKRTNRKQYPHSRCLEEYLLFSIVYKSGDTSR